MRRNNSADVEELYSIIDFVVLDDIELEVNNVEIEDE